MDFGAGTYALGLAAGAASVLSPCVLPILPVLLASALSRHRFGAAVLALGLGLSFAVVGTFLATLGASIGLDERSLRIAAAVLMLAFGAVMLLPRLQQTFAVVGARVAGPGQRALAAVQGDSLGGQFVIGLLLGLVWSPCVGPTLGAATTLAAQGRSLGQVALLMAVFGLGASLPLMLLGLLSGAGIARMRGSLARIGRVAKVTLGALFVALGLMVLTGADHRVEAFLLNHSPAWLTDFTTAF